MSLKTYSISVVDIKTRKRILKNGSTHDLKGIVGYKANLDELKKISSGEYYIKKNYLICKTGEERLSFKRYFKYLSKSKRDKCDSALVVTKSQIYKTIVILDSDLNLISLYTGTLRSLADSLGIEEGTMKAKLNKDVKMIRKGTYTNSERYVYMKDFITL